MESGPGWTRATAALGFRVDYLESSGGTVAAVKEGSFRNRVDYRGACSMRRNSEFRRPPDASRKSDIRKYFDRSWHPLLIARLERLFKDRRLLELLGESSPARVRAGARLPIGSLTSQHFANFYLGWFDRFVKEALRRRAATCATWTTGLVGDDRPTSSGGT